MQSHDKLVDDMHGATQAGGLAAALAHLESTAKTDDQKAALLYNLERGELLRMNRRYQDSNAAFALADKRVLEWEETAKTNPQKLTGMVGAALINERLKDYEGQDYEKVWLSTRMALNRMALGDFENARVDIKRTHEREAVIAEFRAKETVAAEEEAKTKGVSKKDSEINGYPVETLNDPEVLELKNSYSNALSHYLAGFLYEAMNESGLAAPGYRKAIELKPHTPVLEEGLRGLDKRTSFTWKRRQAMTDVLFIVEAGDAPARKPVTFSIPVPTGRGVIATSLSYPVIQPSTDAPLGMLAASGTQLKLEKVVDVNVMARRALKDEMPSMMLRGMSRAIAKGVAQNELQKRAGPLGGLIGMVASVATEGADDRMWRMLPGRVYVARGYLPAGEHRLTVDGRMIDTPVKIEGQYALVPIRLYRNSVLLGSVASLGNLPAGVAGAAGASAGASTDGAAAAASAEAPAKRSTQPMRRATRPARPAVAMQ